MPTQRPSLTVWDGVALTLGVLALLGVFAVALATPHFEAMFRDLGNAELPRLTRLVLRGGARLRFGVPAGLLAAFVAAFVTRPPAVVRFGLAVMIAAVAVMWLYALYEPIFALAGNIQP